MLCESAGVTWIKVKGRKIVGGIAEGEALVSKESISFFGGVNPKSGKVVERGHILEGKCITGKVLIFPFGKGSTVGSYVLYAMAKNKTAPLAIINIETEPIIALGCCLARIPLVDRLEVDPLQVIEDGDLVKVVADEGIVKVRKLRSE